MELNEEHCKIIIKALANEIELKDKALRGLSGINNTRLREIKKLRKTILDAGDILRNCAVNDLSQYNLKKLKFLLLNEEEIPF